MKKKLLAAMTCAVIFAAIPSITSFAGQWKQDAIGYWYQNDHGSYAQNTWVEDGGKWYHFDTNGYMQKSEWVNDSGKWYYLDADGVCLINTTTPDNYTVGSDGARIFQMPATGLPSLESLKLTSTEEQYAFVSQLYDEMYSYNSSDSLWEMGRNENQVPDDMNEIVVDPEYYGALCGHILKKYQSASLAESMSSQNPAIRIYGHYMEEYRQLYIKYLASMSKNLKNNQFSAYIENLNKLEKENSQLDARYEPYLTEISNWYLSVLYSDYSDYYY